MKYKCVNEDEYKNNMYALNLISEQISETLKEVPKAQKHMKGYMFDSLVYRFKDYQSRAFQMEVLDLKNQGKTELDARKIVKNRHDRDLMRFIEILNEAIGDHD